MLQTRLSVWQALLAAQERLHNQVPGFHFNLGFSGKFFHRGTDEENKGDDMLLGKHGSLRHFFSFHVICLFFWDSNFFVLLRQLLFYI